MKSLVHASPGAMLIPRVSWLSVWFLLLMSGQAHAQIHGEELGLQWTAAYNVIWNGTADGSDPFVRASQRFSGRVAARVAHGLYIGASVGSWQIIAVPIGDGSAIPGLVSLVGTAVLASAYGQAYPFHRAGVFVRGGVGYAQTATYYPDVEFIFEDSHTRATVSGGLGIDVAINRHFAVTPSLDYTYLLGTGVMREMKTGLLVGLGLTVR
jgi:hypothetical protein